MNTAVLTGRQVSQVMKVFIVTQAGKVADVTLQSSCHAEDESVIKVSVCFCCFILVSSFVVVTDHEFLICFQHPVFALVWCLLASHSSSLRIGIIGFHLLFNQMGFQCALTRTEA